MRCSSGPGDENPPALKLSDGVGVAPSQVEEELQGRYRVEGLIGTGGNASVWSVVEHSTGRCFAAKRLHRDEVTPRAYYRELRALVAVRGSRLTPLVTLLESERRRRFLIFEHRQGGSLRELMEREAGMDPVRVGQLLIAIAEGINQIHAAGFVHLDLKPENILFRKRPKSTDEDWGATLELTDFGLARTASGTGEGRLSAVSGSPAYMAPELLANRAGPSSDVYALGIIAYELHHGHLPFRGNVAALARAHVGEQPRLADALSSCWRECLRSLMAKRPSDRPQSGDELLARLRHRDRLQLREGAYPQVSEALLDLFVHRWSDGREELLGCGETAVHRIASGDSLRRRAFQGHHSPALASDDSGRLWSAAGHTIGRWDAPERELQQVFEHVRPLRALAMRPGREREDELGHVRVDADSCAYFQGARESFRVSLRNRGGVPMVRWLDFRRFVVTSGPIAPRLHLFDCERGAEALETWALPGRAWRAVSLVAGRRKRLALLCDGAGQGMTLQVLDPEGERYRLLAMGTGLSGMAAQGGELWLLRRDGRAGGLPPGATRPWWGDSMPLLRESTGAAAILADRLVVTLQGGSCRWTEKWAVPSGKASCP